MDNGAGGGAEHREESSFAGRFGLRFLLAYALLYSFPFPLTLAPFGGHLELLWSGAWSQFVLGVAQALGIEVTALPAGSGDTTFNYVELLAFAALALTFALTWVLLPRRVSETRWRALFSLHLRFVLATAMLGYGFAKVFPGQFGPPTLDRLNSTYGESSPMGLLWTLMGLSRPYAIFGGALEVLGGLLLLFPTTAVLGALVSVAVMANVVALNFCFDVPVKLYSSHLLLMACGIALPDARRLLAAGLGRAAQARPSFTWATTGRGLRLVRILRVLVLASIAVSQILGVKAVLSRQESSPPTPLSGLWRFEQRTVGGAAESAIEGVAPLETVFFSDYGVVLFRDAAAGAERLRFALDEAAGTVTLTPFGTPVVQEPPRVLRYSRAGERLELRETLDGAEVVTGFTRVPERGYLLTERGFHWINEFPLNR